MWWDFGKAQIHVFCQQYTSHSSARVETAIAKLEFEIRNIEKGLNKNSDVVTGLFLKEKKLELSSYLLERVKGALVLSCFLQFKYMDAPSSFFFNLEKSAAQKKN